MLFFYENTIHIFDIFIHILRPWAWIWIGLSNAGVVTRNISFWMAFIKKNSIQIFGNPPAPNEFRDSRNELFASVYVLKLDPIYWMWVQV